MTRPLSLLTLAALLPLGAACRTTSDAPADTPAPEVAAQVAPALVVDDLQAALEQAREEDKLVLVRFTGATCVNCRVQEARVLPDPAVAGELRAHYVEARLHTDMGDHSTEHQDLQRTWTDNLAIPSLVVLDPETREVRATRTGMLEPEELAGLLREARQL